MTFNSNGFELLDPLQLYLELSPDALTTAWQQSQSAATPTSIWNAYLNRVCSQTMLSWLQQEHSLVARAYPSSTALPSFWELVNGTAIEFSGVRLVLIPSEAIDTCELRVPQEWVDIPEWVADYYLGVKVNPDDLYLKPFGYCTHQQLKTTGVYDGHDRTYSLDEADLIAELNVFWVVRQLNPQEQTRTAVPPLPAIDPTQAANLIQRLGNPALLNPRLAVPFAQWGALLTHGGWRQRLAEQRQGVPESRSVLQWLQTGISALAQQVGWEQVAFQPSLASARGDEAASPATQLSRPLTIATQAYELTILPLGTPEARTWRFELRPLVGRIPPGLTLRLLTEARQPFAGNEDRATIEVDQLYVDVSLDPGEGIVWEIDPTPEDYDPEILRF